MGREILEVRLQVSQHFRRLLRFAASPIFGLLAASGSDVSLRLQLQLGESAQRESLYNAHTDPRRGAVERIKRYESFVRLRCIVIAQLLQVVLAKIGVNAVLI